MKASIGAAAAMLLFSLCATVAAVEINEVYVVFSTHIDLGYSQTYL